MCLRLERKAIIQRSAVFPSQDEDDSSLLTTPQIPATCSGEQGKLERFGRKLAQEKFSICPVCCLCATAEVHHCRTLNNCRGQGGCGLFGTAEDDATPGANDCAWQGARAVPIQAERFSTQGANKGLSVWVLARKLFEERMQKARRTIGPSPYPCGPPQAWLVKALGSYDSCGSAGDKYCTFGFNDPKKDAQELCDKSLHPVICGSARQSEQAQCGAPEKSGEDNLCKSPKDSETNLCSSVDKK